MSEWISVKDRLPRNHQRVLVSGIQPSMFGRPAYRYHSEDVFFDGQFWECNYNDYWMPWPSIDELPTPERTP